MSKDSSSNEKPGNHEASHLPALVDTELMKALAHVLRQHILLAAVQGPVSPKELSKLLNEGLSQVSYHVTVLKEEGMIELVRTAPRRGAVEHYYRSSAKTMIPAKAWRRLKKGLRAVVGAGQASDLFNDISEAVKAGKLQGTHDHITRTPLVLDTRGQRKLKAIAERANKEAEDEQRAAAKRMAKGNGDGPKVTGVTFGLLAFEAAWEPTDLHGFLAQVEAAAAAKRASGADQSDGRKKHGRKARAEGK